MAEKQREIVIVGGGTAGWLTALTLQSCLPQTRTGPVNFTVVEPSSIGRVGVGEATIPGIKATLSRIGLSERDLLRRTSATFKHGIRFTDWLHGPDHGLDFYFHLFERNESGAFERHSPYNGRNIKPEDFSIPISEIRRIFPADQVGHRYAYLNGIQASLCDRLLPPKKSDMPDYDGLVQYAYHLDAEALGDWLREVGIGRGVRRVDEIVTSAELDENGRIEAIVMSSGERLAGDFFVDCSGFRSILMRKALAIGFNNFGKYLLCDRAAALRVDRRKGEPRPFTTATARRHGWTWDLDLTSRRGMGYVFSSSHLGDEEAERFLRAAAGSAGQYADVRFLPMEVGCLDEFWHGNCAAVGLAAGFIEPLESMGIGLIEIGAMQLAETLVFDDSGAAARVYNKRMRHIYDDILDFIVLHYVLSKRTDTQFWRDATAPERITDSLREKLEIWKHREPSVGDTSDRLLMFPFESYKAVLYGMERFPCLPVAANAKRASALHARIGEACGEAISGLKSHSSTIDEIIKDNRGVTTSAPDVGRQVVPAHPSRGVPRERFGEVCVRVPGALADRLSVSSGTLSASDAGLSDYVARARIPREDWRPLDVGVAERLIGGSDMPQGSRIEVISLDGPAGDAVRRLIRLFAADDGTGAGAMSNRDYALAMADLSASIASFSRSAPRCLGAIAHSAGMLTVTREGPTGPLIGLHLDSWSRAPIGERFDAPNRLCVNLGRSGRYLLFFDKPIAAMAESISSRVDALETLNPTDVGRLFMEMNPDYPVLRVRIEPGEAYIAPTENIIHDGSSADGRGADVSLTFLGNFTASSIDPVAGAHERLK